jgi:hypothetical protein
VVEEREEPIDVERLQGWNPATPPARFAESVVDVWMRERRSVHGGSEPRSRTAIVAAAAIAIAAALVLWWQWPRGSVDEGMLAAESRQTVSLGSRARVVAEPGVTLAWRVGRDGAARVDQSRGSAFYRVDEGTPFEVVTPYGTVTVTGTCFSVEVVQDMGKRTWGKGMALGAALAAAVVVTVYEGGVVLADGHGSVEVGPGERGIADGTGRPSRTNRIDDASSARAEGQLAARVQDQARELERLRTRDAEQLDQISRLREEVEALGGTVDEEDPIVRAKRCHRAMRGEEGCSFVDPDEETLLEMARCGTVKVDQPAFLESDVPSQLSVATAEALGLSSAEEEVLLETARRFRQQYTETLRQLYVEAGGNAALIDDLPPRAIDGMLRTMLDRTELEVAHRLISNERAGLAEPPTDATASSLAERYARHMLDVGNRFESALAETLGPDRAHELRRAEDGWPGGTSVYSGSCDD